jgi:tetratricopeptide (TPR) repeat protein
MFRYGAHGLMLGLDILEGPEQRQQPWALRFPMRLHHRVVVRGKCVQKTKPETHRVNGPGFRYSCDVRSARRQVSFDYVWETTAPEISPAEWREYCQEREKAFAVAGANVLTRRADIKLTLGLIAISGFLLANAAGVFLSPDIPRPAPVDTQTIQQQMRVATDAINKGDYERARLLLAPLAPHYEDSAEYHLLDAKAALETGDLNSARRAIDLARALSVDLVAADVLEGLWHERRGDLPRARTFYEKALTAVPDDAQTLLLLAPVLEQLGDLTAAKQLWEKFLTAHPAHPDSVFNYALILWRNGERTRADAMIHGIIQAQPVANANVESNLSSYYTNTGRHAEALAAAKRAVDLAPKAPDQIFIYTMALLQDGKAIAAFDFVKGKAQEGTHPQVWRALAIAAASANQRSEAERAFKEWQAASPGDPDAQSNYGFFLLQTGRAPEARALLERGIHEFPDNGMMWLNYSAVLSALGDPGAAASRAKADVLTPARTRETLIR